MGDLYLRTDITLPFAEVWSK